MNKATLGGYEDAHELEQNGEFRGQYCWRVPDTVDIKQLAWPLATNLQITHCQPQSTSYIPLPKGLDQTLGHPIGVARGPCESPGQSTHRWRSVRAVSVISLLIPQSILELRTHDITQVTIHVSAFTENIWERKSRERKDLQSSSRNRLLDPRRLVVKRTTMEAVANERHRTAVTAKAGLCVYGFTKFGVTPGGGERAGASLEVVELMMLPFQK